MSNRSVPILYEDDRGPVKEFGLHELIVACVADEWGQDWWAVKGQFDAIPLKGAAKLLAACERDVPDMPDALIFAVFDADKLHRLLFTSGRPSSDELLAELRRRCSDPRLSMFLLDQNTETVVDAVADCLGEPRPEKRKLLRDRFLNRTAKGLRQHRDCVRAAVPTLDACVREIAALTRQ
ncbi:hypothetical protein DB30_05306 [Enhygromyxa salina]|uniref:Uncharacterized protein n=1 Tax=Enhygromyxa salina TaxID=215803 RepID=A0A0C2CXN0_9BACT|nr:hypothetical protein [Enhygromyxa salina]KIG15736.1 hypothetical protein DB30_05306 [Enhygromyxa salina]